MRGGKETRQQVELRRDSPENISWRNHDELLALSIAHVGCWMGCDFVGRLEDIDSSKHGAKMHALNTGLEDPVAREERILSGGTAVTKWNRRIGETSEELKGSIVEKKMDEQLERQKLQRNIKRCQNFGHFEEIFDNAGGISENNRCLSQSFWWRKCRYCLFLLYEKCNVLVSQVATTFFLCKRECEIGLFLFNLGDVY